MTRCRQMELPEEVVADLERAIQQADQMRAETALGQPVKYGPLPPIDCKIVDCTCAACEAIHSPSRGHRGNGYD